MQHVGPHPALRATFSRTREKDSTLLGTWTKAAFSRTREKDSTLRGAWTKTPFSRAREKDDTLRGAWTKTPFSRAREKVPEGRMRAISIRTRPTATRQRLAWTFATSDAHKSIA
ncbi:hypothetical protein Y887_14765 [Xanthomonas pisi DSM 18956]|uniref:Uncharacterized protein n=2 Tax=Xanthomonas pisi TaxID=56457 RepID=A0A2S7D7Y9_9XANT|nr:hypothetical protein Y887_14765 [Xanthomonas pisi DSM 18956]PPU69941.1 hypothetical protein XpiCFBP4643_03795 [Xanthomonas pisi]